MYSTYKKINVARRSEILASICAGEKKKKKAFYQDMYIKGLRGECLAEIYP